MKNTNELDAQELSFNRDDVNTFVQQHGGITVGVRSDTKTLQAEAVRAIDKQF